MEEVLSDGPVPAGQAREEAEETGISLRTLERAKKRMGVISYRENTTGEKRGKGQWYWKLPVVDLVDEPSNTANDSFKTATPPTLENDGGLEREEHDSFKNANRGGLEDEPEEIL